MAVSIETKVDLLLKKLSGVTKTDTPGNKSASNESISSPALNRGDRIWLNSYLIPTTANPTLGTVESYFQNNRVECVPDTTSQKVSNVYPTWKTNLTDWIPPEFDSVNIVNTYRVKVFYGSPGIADPTASIPNQQIFADGSLGVGEWNFDYQSGVLNFYGGTIPSGMNSSHVIYILGFRYVGPTGFNSVFKVDLPIMRGDLLLPTLITLRGDTVVEKNLVVEEDLEIQGGDLTTTENVFNLLNTTATTINFGGDATDIQIGAATGTTNINNNLDVDGDVTIDGGDLKVTTTTFNLIPDIAENVNFAGAATNLVVGATTGTTNVRNNLDVDGDLNVDGDFHIGNDLDVDGDLNIDGGDLTVSTAQFNLANENATTINFGGAATIIEIGSEEGITNVNNNLDVDGDVNIDGGDLTVSTETFNLANSTAKNVNFAGEATNIEIGSNEGNTNVNNNLRVDGIVDVNNSLYVEGEARVSSSLEVEDSVKVQRELAVEGDTQITRDLNVGGYIKAGKLVDTMIDCGEY